MKETEPLKNAKIAAARCAARLIMPGMIVGLGTGSTASYFIAELAQRVKDGLSITACATSERSLLLAKNGGIKIANIQTLTHLDVAVDGADEIDQDKAMIKGGGGALLREKIVAQMSQEMIVIVDEHKLVTKLGAFALPVEILPFGYRATLKHIKDLDLDATLRIDQTGNHYMTDNGNYIADIKFSRLIDDPSHWDKALRAIPGVIETGFFIKLAGRVIVGYENGQIEVR